MPDNDRKAESMKKIISIILVCAAVLSLASCSFDLSPSYEDYLTGGAEFTDKVTDLTIDWLNGKVIVEYGDTDSVVIGESAKKDIPSGYEMCHKMTGSLLSIAYSKKSSVPADLAKDLTVVIPRGTKLNAVYVNTVSADVEISDISAPGIAELETVSGKISARLTGSIPKMMATTVSGSITLDTGKIGEGVFKTTSGDMKLLADEAPKRATFDTMSGDISLYYPKNSGMTVDFSSISGEFTCGYDKESSGTTHKIGSGDAKLIVTSISGNLRLCSPDLDNTPKDIER